MKVIATYNRFRVCTISSFDGSEKPIKEGLGIEYQLRDIGGSWIVLAFYEYDPKLEKSVLQYVSDRVSLISTNPYEIYEFQTCCEIARHEILKERSNEN